MSEDLRKAAIELYGLYNNGAGVERPLAVHETLGDVDYEVYGVAMDGITAAIQEAYQASEGQDGYKAHRRVSEAIRTSVKGTGFTDRQIARVALSEISAEWVTETSPDAEHVKTVASLVMKSRLIAREFLKLFRWDDGLDID